MTSFLDANRIKKFILKLVIPATDDTPEQIRRVKLPRVVDHLGQVSYEELVGLVLTFHSSGDDDNENEDNVNNNDGQMSLASMTSTRSVVKKVVQFDYQDVDGDKVTIASTEELVDALEQFRDQGTLRIATRIVTTTKTAPSLATSVPRLSGSHIGGGSAARSVCSMGTTTSTIKTNRSASNAREATAPHNNNIASRSNSSTSSMVNTIVGALANVVVSLEGGMNQQQPRSAVAEEPKSEPRNDVEAEEKPTAQVETTSSKKEEEADTKEQGTDASPPSSGSRPFIHGRHTCDSCLVSPIVGKRYHATNLPDYDVCEVCFENYQGKDIQFEAVQHERDMAFQDRWNRKRARAEVLSDMLRPVRKCGVGRPGRRGGPGGGRRGGWGRGCGGGPGSCHGPRWHLHHGQPPHGVPPPSCPPPPAHDFDHALTEAIRRSLEDVGLKPEDEVMADVEKVVEVEAKPTTSVPEAPSEEEIVVPPIAAAVIQTTAPTNTDSKSNLKPAPVVEEDDVGIVGVVTEAMGALDMVAGVIDEMMQDAHAKFEDTMLEATAATAAEDDKPDVVESNSSGLNEWQIVAEDEDENEVIQPMVSIVTEEQRQRWFAQLSQLREIGFYDEGQCVETLERLHAANIGSDVADEEVSVTRVVNEILKQQK